MRCKDAGSLDSSAIEATEDAAACVPSAFRRPVLILLELLKPVLIALECTDLEVTCERTACR